MPNKRTPPALRLMMLRQAIRRLAIMANAVRSARDKVHAENDVRDAIKARKKASAVFRKFGAL
jgi:hypothetical protein